MALKKKPFPGSRLALSLGLIVISAAYALWQNTLGQQAAVSSPQPVTTGAPLRGQYIDGSYVGDATDAYYGTLQVKAIVAGGRITDVQFLQHADSTENSIFINNRAMPLLTQEAIQAQSATVDGVSGATFTSQAFRESLASALAKAK